MWSATCSWRSSRRLQRAGVARAPSNLRCGPGTVTSDGITDVVQRVPVTCEEIPSRERGELPVVEGVRRHLLSHDGRWQLSLSQNLEESDRTERTFLLCLSTCRSCERTFGERNTSRGDHLHDMHSNGAHNRFLAVGAMYGAPCAKAKENKSFTSYETCAIMFITSERSVRNCLRFNIVAWQKHFRSLISRSCPCDMLLFPCDLSLLAA